MGGFESKSTTYAPMGCLTNTRNENKLCVALSDAVTLINLQLVFQKKTRQQWETAITRITDVKSHIEKIHGES